MKTWAYVKYIDHGHNAGGGKPVVSFSKSLSERNSFFFFFVFPLKARVSWTPVTSDMHQSAGTTVSSACVPVVTTHDTLKNKKRKKKKKVKLPGDPWPVTPGHIRPPPCAYGGGSKRVYDCIISPTPSSPLHPSVDTRKPRCRSRRQTGHHSFTRLLGAFVRWLLGGKRKTDQYISHGPDR